MFTRADIQRSKQALQMQLMTQEIISIVVAFLTKGAHTLEVLHRVHASALLMMHNYRNLCRVKEKKEYHWWQIKHVQSTDEAEMDRDPPCSFG